MILIITRRRNSRTMETTIPEHKKDTRHEEQYQTKEKPSFWKKQGLRTHDKQRRAVMSTVYRNSYPKQFSASFQLLSYRWSLHSLNIERGVGWYDRWILEELRRVRQMVVDRLKSWIEISLVLHAVLLSFWKHPKILCIRTITSIISDNNNNNNKGNN